MIGRFILRNEDKVFGTVQITELDMPFWLGTFEPRPAHEGIRYLFERELKASTDTREWSSARDDIKSLGLWLESANGEQAIRDFILHIDGARVTLRYDVMRYPSAVPRSRLKGKAASA